MIVGIGTDIVHVSKLKNSLLKWDRKFIRRVFTTNEEMYCRSKADPYPHFAGRFAAKEATKKALAPLRLSATPFLSIEVVRGNDGEPKLEFSKKLQKKLASIRSHVTLSHHGSYATATVILEKLRLTGSQK